MRDRARRVSEMLWTNGTRTLIEVEGERVVVTDISERLGKGKDRVSRSIDETLDLADDHDRLAHELREAARLAWANLQKRKDDHHG